MDKNAVFFSIIIPVFNVENYLQETLSSVFNQTFKSFEVILINDGSTDRSLDIITGFLEGKDLNWKIINQENLGVSASRNKGIEFAIGDFVLFLDSDDLIHNEYLSIACNILNETNTNFLTFRFKRFVKSKNLINLKLKKSIYKKIRYEEIMLDYLDNGSLISMGSFIVSRTFLKSNGINFASNYKWDEDNHFIWNCLMNVENIVTCEKKLYFYRKRIGSAMNTFDIERFNSVELYRDIFKKLIMNNHTFAETFQKFAIPRWYWSTVWQSTKFYTIREFTSFLDEINMDEFKESLVNFNKFKIRVSSKLLFKNRVLFYLATKIYLHISNK